MTSNQSLHLRIDVRILLIPVSMKPVLFWKCKDWIFGPKKIWSLHHQICTSAIDMGIKWMSFSIWRCKYHYGSHPPSASTYRGNPYFEMTFFMTWNQSLHLCIDDRIWLIPISMGPVWFWQCEDWIFDNGNKNPVTAPQICIRTIVIGVKWITLSVGRCKDHIRSQPHSVLMCRVSPYFRIMSPWPEPGLAPPYWWWDLNDTHFNVSGADLAVWGPDLSCHTHMLKSHWNCACTFD